MLLSNLDHDKLLLVPWIQIDTGKDDTQMDGPLYVKALFDRTEYRILVTNLRYVWFEFGDVTSITKRASSYRLDIESENQIESLIVSLQQCFQQPKNLKFQLSNGGQMTIEYKDNSKGFAALTWKFDCDPLESAILGDDDAYLDGPTVLYKHFIHPMVAMTESNWSNQTVDKDEAVPASSSSYMDYANGGDDDTQGSWLTQLPMVSELGQDESDNDEQEEHDQQKENPVKHESTSSPPKTMTELEKELERRQKLECELTKKRGIKRRKQRIF